MNHWTPKLVALDADGTIVGADDEVPYPIVDKLRQIDSRGIPIVLVTGRAWLSAKIVLDQLGLPRMYCVCNNGATVVTYPPLEVVRAETFDPEPIVEAIRDQPSVIMAVEDFGRGYRTSRPFPPGIYDLHGELTVVPWEDLAKGPVSRVIIRDPAASAQEFDALVSRLDLHGLYWSKSADNWIDIGPGGAGKAKGLAYVAGLLGIRREDVLAMGDSYNDVDLLSWAGRGVALGDAPPELTRVADFVTARFDQNGTLAELDRWFPGREGGELQIDHDNCLRD